MPSGIFLANCRDGEADVDYAAVFKGNTVSEIRDKYLAVLYSKGKRNAKYVFWEEVGGPTTVKELTEAGISAILKAPSTAVFPGSFLDPFEGWGFKKTAGSITVTGYVDSENSFGAMIRSKFKLIFRVSTGKNRGKLDPVYVNFDGHVDDRR